MPRRRFNTSEQRRLEFEQFEKRLVMSAQAVASILPELEIASPAITQQAVALDHAASEAARIAEQYGFDGAGQTVAVIDSGIAWDHYALGGGFGEGHKVVGGWDFAENDADPYDDGPAGFHGSHVSGIIGSTDDQYRGVSSGADLVGLRVFGDNGEGNLDWVEQALRWVHEHKNDFANPITTVNLSLGTSLDPESMSEWANLEDEFALLKADGMFISVAAGNSFRTIGDVGLSYPAVSPHVVPVASHDAEGSMSDFSQRDEGVLVAPGEMLRSTVPDHLFGGQTGQFLGSTGTSMAAPYVAGASAILRQANEFMGVENVTQDLLYQQFRDSADRIFDSMTGGYYYKINLEAALAEVVKDHHSDSAEFATNAGVLGGGESIHGTIGRLADVDHFEFTAERTGRMTLRFEVTDEFVPLVDVGGNFLQITNNEISFDVVAGQQYDFAVATANGAGHYKINIDVSDAATAVDWGSIVSREFSGLQVAGESMFEMTAIRNGFLTVESTAELSSGQSFMVELYDRQMNLIQSAQTQTGKLRLDVQAQAGETFFLKTIGHSESVDVRVSNLVSLNDGYLMIHGTNQVDDVVVQSGDQYSVSVNGVEYQFDHAEVSQVRVHGHQGADSIALRLGAENDRVNTRADGVSVSNQQRYFNSFGFESVNVVGGGGYDVASMLDSSGDDRLVSRSTDSGTRWSVLAGANFRSQVIGFDVVYARSSGGKDQASLSGTSGDDVFVSRGNRNILRMSDATILFDNFETVSADGAGGHDVANLNDSEGNDRFVLSPRSGSISNENYSVSVAGFARLNAFATRGFDTVSTHDSVGDDVFFHRAGISVVSGAGYLNFTQGFDQVQAHSVGGNDHARIFDTTGNDRFFVDSNHARLSAAGLQVSATGFQIATLIADQGGMDHATMEGTQEADTVYAGPDKIRMEMSNGRTSQVVGAEQVQIDTLAGRDRAMLIGTENRDVLKARYDEVELETTLQMLRMTNVEQTNFEGNGGGDEVIFDEVGELDLLESLGDQATVYLRDQVINAEDFDFLEARTVDDAIAEYDLEAVDYLYILRGQWARKS